MSTREVDFLAVDDVLGMHARQLARFGGSAGLCNALLASRLRLAAFVPQRSPRRERLGQPLAMGSVANVGALLDRHGQARPTSASLMAPSPISISGAKPRAGLALRP